MLIVYAHIAGKVAPGEPVTLELDLDVRSL